MQFRQLSSFCQSRSRIHFYLFSGHTSITLFSFTIASILFHWSASFFLCFLVRPFLLNFLGKTFLYCFLMRTFTIILGVQQFFFPFYTQFSLWVLFEFPFTLPFWVYVTTFIASTPNSLYWNKNPLRSPAPIIKKRWDPSTESHLWYITLYA